MKEINELKEKKKIRYNEKLRVEKKTVKKLESKKKKKKKNRKVDSKRIDRAYRWQLIDLIMEIIGK